ncbi:GntR family transcriptional regulator [Paracoccus zhejiangensis]|uniref:GntR family transcriptional regulator n=1 Tax=Paracoccus zhejiangensis TaxID=1077935 RepID=A0A2H5EZ73_9RHOB|nr:GntR family transcriptional regulator [Paracoccus zhejiangensis]AUH64597.1 GntR family transcriptional regulator [Paracoccus zhejiangensis]
MDKPIDLVIVDSVLDAIADQRLRAGTKLGEQALSDLFGANRALVRRALAQLTAYQVVDHLPNRGAFVATPTPDDARNVFQARRAIEATICRNAVRQADEADLADLRAHLAAEAAAHGDNRPSAVRLSRQFHLLLARVGRNPVLSRYLEELVMRSSLIIGLYAARQGVLCAEDDHSRIVDAIAARDEALALRLLDQHLRQIEAGVRFGDVPPVTGALSAMLQRPGE